MSSLALLLALVPQGYEAFPPTPFDRVIPLVIDEQDPVLAGHGRAERVTYKAEFSGTLHLWTKSAGELDLFLRVETPSGALVKEDDDSGGGKTPYVRLEVQAGRELVVVTAVAQGEGQGASELCAIAAPETAETRTAAAAVEAALGEIKRLGKAGDLDAARTCAQQSLRDCLAVPGARSSELMSAKAWDLGFETDALGELQLTLAAWEPVLTQRRRTLPGAHPDLQAVRFNVALTLASLGDHERGRALLEQVHEVLAQQLPEEHLDLQRVRQSLALTLKALGELPTARALEQRVLDSYSRTLPDEHRDLQRARQNLAGTLQEQGQLDAAHALFERVHAVYSRTLPAEHHDLQLARLSLAGTTGARGDLHGARALGEGALEIFTRTLPEGHPDLELALANLAATLSALGELQAARTLEERVLEALARDLPEEHRHLQAARSNLALTLRDLGDFEAARALQERALEVLSRTLPEEHPDLQAARQNLAETLLALGDPASARLLLQRVLEVSSRTLPDSHPDLQAARLGLAGTLAALGDLRAARALEEQALAAFSQTLPDEHPDLQAARLNLAATLRALGELQGARALLETVLEVRSRTLPADHPELQSARQNLALNLHWEAARAAFEPGGDEQRAGAAERARQRSCELLRERSLAQARSARDVRLDVPGREAEARCESLAAGLGITLSVALGRNGSPACAGLQSAAFAYSESTRNAAVSSSALGRRATRSEEYAAARAQLRHATEELARRVQGGTDGEGYRTALAARQAAEAALLELGRRAAPRRATSLEIDVETLSAALEPGAAAIAYRGYVRHEVEWQQDPGVQGRHVPKATSVESLCAFLVRRDAAANGPDAAATLMLLDLGPAGVIREAAHAWRAAIGADSARGLAPEASAADRARERGVELRKLVLDPLLARLGAARHIVVVGDDVLQLVPLEALPLDELPGDPSGARGPQRESRAAPTGAATATPGAAPAALVGDRYRVELRATLAELLDAPLPFAGAQTLCVVGGVSYNSEPLQLEAEEPAALETSTQLGERGVGLLRGTIWERGFEPLPYTGQEARGIEALYSESFDEQGQALLLDKRKASRSALQELAPRARWLHIATHGWFAPTSIRSWEDRDPVDAQSGLALRLSGEETVKGMSPMLLCGLALAGANLPEDALGRLPGLVTADELSTLDLSNCELAVLSACDTARGEMRRAGQGVASLQKALQIAGARSVITSLWKVPDEATKELMLDFYRRVWVEKKPKWQALWEAKTRLREAQDERGQPKYALRDWAAWVLTGEPE